MAGEIVWKMSPEGMVQTYIQWVRWAGILAAAFVVIRLVVGFWRFRGMWKLTPNTSIHVTVSSTPLSTGTRRVAPTGHMQYGPGGVSLTPTVHTTRIVAHSADEIPKELLDALTPEQRKMVLEHLPATSQTGAAKSAQSVPKKQ